MSLAVIDALSMPGDAAKPNEDSFGHGDHAAVVMDGATPLGDEPGDGLMPGPSDAAWIAQFGARRLLAHLRDGAGARKAVRGALADAQKSFEALRRAAPQAMWQVPCASMMLAAEGDDGIEMLWFGDCAALVQQGDGPVQVIGHIFDSRAAEAQRAQAIMQGKSRAPVSGIRQPHVLDALRAGRNRLGSGNYWLFMPDVKAASHVSRRVLTLAPGAVILLASDGLLALASDYGAYNADTLMAAAQDRGLAALGEELRAIEAADPNSEKYPRFKPSDDATGLLLRLV